MRTASRPHVYAGLLCAVLRRSTPDVASQRVTVRACRGAYDPGHGGTRRRGNRQQSGLSTGWAAGSRAYRCRMVQLDDDPDRWWPHRPNHLVLPEPGKRRGILARCRVGGSRNALSRHARLVLEASISQVRIPTPCRRGDLLAGWGWSLLIGIAAVLVADVGL